MWIYYKVYIYLYWKRRNISHSCCWWIMPLQCLICCVYRIRLLDLFHLSVYRSLHRTKAFIFWRRYMQNSSVFSDRHLFGIDKLHFFMMMHLICLLHKMQKCKWNTEIVKIRFLLSILALHINVVLGLINGWFTKIANVISMHIYQNL